MDMNKARHIIIAGDVVIAATQWCDTFGLYIQMRPPFMTTTGIVGDRLPVEGEVPTMPTQAEILAWVRGQLRAPYNNQAVTVSDPSQIQVVENIPVV